MVEIREALRLWLQGQGLRADPETGRRRVNPRVGLYPRWSPDTLFVWLTHSQTLEAVIAGFEAAWALFDGVFKVVMTECVPRHIFGLLDAGHAGTARCGGWVSVCWWCRT